MHILPLPRPLPLQLLDRLHDPGPQPLAVEVALVQELVGAHGGFGGGAVAVVASWHSCRPVSSGRAR